MVASRVDIFRTRHRIIKAIRRFFDESGYVEVDTPCLVRFPGIDAYIDAIEVSGGRFLITSPELQMKRLVAEGMEAIYQIGHAFREGESGSWHNPEFTMLEWYRVGAGYLDAMVETENLVREVARCTGDPIAEAHFERWRVGDAFQHLAGWNPCFLWDEDRFFKDLVEKVEPALRTVQAVFIQDFPAPLAGQAAISSQDPAVCERFELYLKGVEIANGYSELRDAREQKKRFSTENEKRLTLGKKPYPLDESFLKMLQRGLPQCAGVALGIDRLVASLLNVGGIREVMVLSEWEPS